MFNKPVVSSYFFSFCWQFVMILHKSKMWHVKYEEINNDWDCSNQMTKVILSWVVSSTGQSSLTGTGVFTWKNDMRNTKICLSAQCECQQSVFMYIAVWHKVIHSVCLFYCQHCSLDVSSVIFCITESQTQA